MHLRRLAFCLLSCSALATMLVLGRILVTDQITYYWLVVPNLLLAWVPFVAALLLRRYAHYGRPRWWGFAGLGAIWLAFLPNAPYITTDFIHLTNRYGGVPIQFDIAVLTFVAVTGLVLGFASVDLVRSLIPQRWGRWVVALGCWPLASVGIYLGRVERWNSWDLLHAPWTIVQSIIDIWAKPEARAIVGSYSLVLPALYLLYRSLAHP